MTGTTTFSWKQWLPFGLAMLLSVVYLVLFFQLDGPTFEDAAMLMRYADNLAAAEGIVWNPGGPHVDGATDFLFMLAVAALHKMGLGLDVAVRTLTLGAHLMTMGLVYGTLLHKNVSTWVAGVIAFWVGTGPGLVYVEAYFGTPFFALFGLAAFICFLRMMETELSLKWSVLMGMFGLLAALTRPEGNFLAGAMWIGLLLEHGIRRSRMVTLGFWAWFGTIGLAYFAWHWWYFGHPFPNPFYIKGGGSLHLGSLKAAFLNTLKMAVPLLPFLLLPIFRGAFRKRSFWHSLTPFIVFGLVWLLMSNAMNYGMRFQYVLFPMLAVVWAQWYTPETWKRWFPKYNGAAIMVLTLGMGYQFFSYAAGVRMPKDQRVSLGIELAELADKKYTMAVTEAGNLPFYSGWKAIDTWGLNDKWIAHNGIVTTEYLDEHNPQLIMAHLYWSPGVPRVGEYTDWNRMSDTLMDYVDRRNYEPVGWFGDDPNSTHAYFLNPACPDVDKIKAMIQSSPYSWYENGLPAEDFLKRAK